MLTSGRLLLENVLVSPDESFADLLARAQLASDEHLHVLISPDATQLHGTTGSHDTMHFGTSGKWDHERF